MHGVRFLKYCHISRKNIQTYREVNHFALLAKSKNQSFVLDAGSRRNFQKYLQFITILSTYRTLRMVRRRICEIYHNFVFFGFHPLGHKDGDVWHEDVLDLFFRSVMLSNLFVSVIYNHNPISVSFLSIISTDYETKLWRHRSSYSVEQSQNSFEESKGYRWQKSATMGWLIVKCRCSIQRNLESG